MAINNYSFTDQLFDTKINLSVYLEKLSTTNYTLKFNNNQPVIATVKNLFAYSTLINNYKTNSSAFVKYELKEGELPEDISLKYYNTEDFYWAILLFNNISNMFTQWPYTEEQILELTDLFVQKEDKYSKEGYYNLIFETNESKRNLDVLKIEHLYSLISEIKSDVVQTNNTQYNFTIDL